MRAPEEPSGPLGGPCGVPGKPLGVLVGSLGGPWGALGGLGGPLGILGVSLDRPEPLMTLSLHPLSYDASPVDKTSSGFPALPVIQRGVINQNHL